MTEDRQQSSDHEQAASQRPRVRLPGFVNEDDIGLGSALKRASYSLGIKPCAGCERRARTLNRWVGFSGRHRH